MSEGRGPLSKRVTMRRGFSPSPYGKALPPRSASRRGSRRSEKTSVRGADAPVALLELLGRRIAEATRPRARWSLRGPCRRASRGRSPSPSRSRRLSSMARRTLDGLRSRCTILLRVDVLEREDHLPADAPRTRSSEMPRPRALHQDLLERRPAARTRATVKGSSTGRRPSASGSVDRRVVEEADDVRVGPRRLAEHAQHLSLALEARERLGGWPRRAAAPSR